MAAGDRYVPGVHIRGGSAYNALDIDSNGSARTRISGDSEMVAVVASGLATIEYPHVLANSGMLGIASHRYDDIVDDGSATLMIIPDATNDMHMGFRMQSEGQWNFDMYAMSSSIAHGGTELLIVSKNQNNQGDGQFGATMYTQVTGIDTSADTDNTLLSGVMGSQAARAGSTDAGNWILEAGNSYLLQMVNKAGATRTVAVEVEFHEC